MKKEEAGKEVEKQGKRKEERNTENDCTLVSHRFY